MALLWIEGFEGYGTTTGVSIDSQLARRYASVTSLNNQLAAGRLGGYGLTCAYSGGSLPPGLLTPALTTDPTLAVGMAIKFSNISAAPVLFRLYDGATMGISVNVNSAGEIQVYRSTTLLGTTSGAGIVTGSTWYYIEVKVYCHTSAGTVEVRVNGVSKLSLASQNTKFGSDAYHDRVMLGAHSYGYVTVDDIYVLDGSGSVNNTFLGNQKVIGIFPTGDASVTWARSAGATSYNLVNENPSDDASYVQSPNSGDTDLYTYTSVPPVSSVAGIQINTTCKESGATAHTLITQVKSGATVSDDAAQPIYAEGYVDRRRIVELDPATGEPWTQSGLAAAQIGVKVG